MPNAPAVLTSPKIKKLAQKALKSPMMTTAETQQLGTSVMTHVSPPKEVFSFPGKKAAAKKTLAKKAPAKRS